MLLGERTLAFDEADDRIYAWLKMIHDYAQNVANISPQQLTSSRLSHVLIQRKAERGHYPGIPDFQ
jgi:hypothetical protein